MCRLDSGLPRDTRNKHFFFFEGLLAREGPSSAVFESSRNSGIIFLRSGTSATTGNTMEHGRGAIREPQSSTIPSPRLNQGVATLNPSSYTEGTHSRRYDRLPEVPDLGNAS